MGTSSVELNIPRLKLIMNLWEIEKFIKLSYSILNAILLFNHRLTCMQTKNVCVCGGCGGGGGDFLELFSRLMNKILRTVFIQNINIFLQ